MSDNHPSGNARAIVEAMADPRVRYVGTGQDLSMPDSWEFALGHARGEFITYLCDDDALCPSLLACADDVLRRGEGPVVAWLGASYADASWPDPDSRNKLLLPTFTREVLRYRSRARLTELFRLEGYGLPMLVNSLCPRALIDRIRSRESRFFFGAAPDYSTAAVILSQIDSYAYIDQVLSIGGATAQSIGITARQNRGEAFQRYLGEFESAKLLKHVPLRLLTANNIVADTLLEVRDVLGGRLRAHDLDWACYFLACFGEIVAYERAGADAREEREHFFATLAQQPPAVRTRVRAGLVERPPAPSGPPVLVDCPAAGLHSILDCARFVEHVPLSTKGQVKRAIIRVGGQRLGLALVRVLQRVSRRRGSR